MAEAFYLSDIIEEPVYTDTLLSYMSISVKAARFAELKNGQIAWDNTVDLRGKNAEVVRQSIIELITAQRKKHTECILLVYDKEFAQQKNPPIIKNYLNVWLRQFKEVAAFHSAQIKRGDYEALFVLFKKPAERPKNKAKQGSSYLVNETKEMDRNRRLAEQQGERQFGRVNARNHSTTEEIQPAPEGELQNNILQHPELDSQRFDGIDPNLNPEPPLNSEARKEFDNDRREQEMEKQLRLGNMPKFSTAPTPKGP